MAVVWFCAGFGTAIVITIIVVVATFIRNPMVR